LLDVTSFRGAPDKKTAIHWNQMLSCEQSLLLFWLFVSIVQTSYHFLNHPLGSNDACIKGLFLHILIGWKKCHLCWHFG